MILNIFLILQIILQLTDTVIYNIKLIAEDYLKDSSFMDILLRIKKPDNKLIITSKPDTIAYVDKEYQYEVKFSNPSIFSSLIVTEGKPYKPSNLKIHNSTITFTPTTFYANKTIELTIGAINIYGDTTFQIIQIKVKEEETSIINKSTVLKENKNIQNSPIYLINGKKVIINNKAHTIFVKDNNKVIFIKNNSTLY
jgi:hypothetical protein